MAIGPIPDPCISVAAGWQWEKPSGDGSPSGIPTTGALLELGGFVAAGAAALMVLDVSSLSLWPGG